MRNTFRIDRAGTCAPGTLPRWNDLVKQPAQSSVARATVEAYPSEFESLCHAVNVLGEASPRALDAISSLGERMSIQLIAAYLKSIGVAAEPIESSDLVVTDEHFQAANPIDDLTRSKTQNRLLPLLDKGSVPIVTGFIGATQDWRHHDAGPRRQRFQRGDPGRGARRRRSVDLDRRRRRDDHRSRASILRRRRCPN